MMSSISCLTALTSLTLIDCEEPVAGVDELDLSCLSLLTALQLLHITVHPMKVSAPSCLSALQRLKCIHIYICTYPLVGQHAHKSHLALDVPWLALQCLELLVLGSATFSCGSHSAELGLLRFTKYLTFHTFVPQDAATFYHFGQFLCHMNRCNKM